MTGIPPLDVEAARSRGITLESDMAELWRQHLEWAHQRNLQVAGGTPWRGFLDAVVRKRNAAASKVAKLAEQAKLRQEVVELERQKRQEAETAYEAEAISLESYLESLRFKSELTEAEDALVSAEPPKPGEDIGAWMVTVLKGAHMRRPIGVLCACGRIVASWYHMGTRYESNKCFVCGKAEDKARELLGAQAP